MNVPLHLSIAVTGMIALIVCGVILCAYTAYLFGAIAIPLWFGIVFVVFFLGFSLLEWLDKQ